MKKKRKLYLHKKTITNLSLVDMDLRLGGNKTNGHSCNNFTCKGATCNRKDTCGCYVEQ